jgi:hypothetical protein
MIRNRDQRKGSVDLDDAVPASRRWSPGSWKSFDASEASFDPDQCDEVFDNEDAYGKVEHGYWYEIGRSGLAKGTGRNRSDQDFCLDPDNDVFDAHDGIDHSRAQGPTSQSLSSPHQVETAVTRAILPPEEERERCFSSRSVIEVNKGSPRSMTAETLRATFADWCRHTMPGFPAIKIPPRSRTTPSIPTFRLSLHTTQFLLTSRSCLGAGRQSCALEERWQLPWSTLPLQACRCALAPSL